MHKLQKGARSDCCGGNVGDTFYMADGWASTGVYVLSTCGFKQNWMIRWTP